MATQKFQREQKKYDFKRVQDTPPQNMSLCHIDYFELKPLEKQQTQGEAFSELPLSA